MELYSNFNVASNFKKRNILTAGRRIKAPDILSNQITSEAGQSCREIAASFGNDEISKNLKKTAAMCHNFVSNYHLTKTTKKSYSLFAKTNYHGVCDNKAGSRLEHLQTRIKFQLNLQATISSRVYQMNQ